MTETVERCGDTELWVVTDEKWELPVLAEPFGNEGKQTHWRLRPPLDCPLQLEMLKALDERIRAFKLPVKTDHVIVKYEDLQKVARKAPGITSGYYIRWPGTEPDKGDLDPQQLLGTYDKVPVSRDFIDWLFRRTQVSDHATMLLTWKAICQYGAEFMIEKKKPIDFGFVKIAPIPYRPNWRNIMAMRFPMAMGLMTTDDVPRGIRDELNLKTGMIKELFNTVLCAFRPKDGWLAWTLEAIPQWGWYYANATHERAMYLKLGPVRYSDYWRSTIKKMLPHILQSFREWLKGNSLPCAQPDDGPLFGGRRLVSWVPPGRIIPARPSAGTESVVVSPDWTALKGPPTTKPFPASNGHLPELSDILPEPRHVRIGYPKSQQ